MYPNFHELIPVLKRHRNNFISIISTARIGVVVSPIIGRYLICLSCSRAMQLAISKHSDRVADCLHVTGTPFVSAAATADNGDSSGPRLGLPSTSGCDGVSDNLHIFLACSFKGASINDIRKIFGFFDPLIPLVCIWN